MLKTPTWKHFAAFIYDIFPIFGILVVTSGITLVFRQGNDVQPYTWWFILLVYLEISIYYIYFWKVGGQTIGMKAWKLKIIPKNNNQTSLTWPQSILRFFVGVFSTLLAGLGIFWKTFSKENLTWMDIISQSQTITTDD